MEFAGMLSVNSDGADTSRYKCLLSHQWRTARVIFWQGARRSHRVHFDGTCGGLTEPPPLPPLHQGFHGESSWFPISLSHLLGYQRGAHCLALNYWSGICIIFFLLSDFQRNTVAGKLLCHHQPLVLNHAKMNLATGTSVDLRLCCWLDYKAVRLKCMLGNIKLLLSVQTDMINNNLWLLLLKTSIKRLKSRLYP